jgi:predicted transposase YdaD
MIKKEEVIQQVLSEAGKRGGAPKGRIPWNKGKKGVQKNPYLAELNMSRRGQPISEEAKAKVSAANSGRKRPDLAERNKKRKGMDIPRDENGKFISKK